MKIKTALFLILPAFVLGNVTINTNKLSLGSKAFAQEEKKEGEAAGPSYIEMKPLNLPIVDDQGVSQTVSVVVSLEVADAAAAAEAEKMKPRLTDAYIQDMYGALSKKTMMEGGVIQVIYLKDRLNKVTTKVLGEHKVKDVLLQIVAQRPV